jgi:uncharacterized membrane protein
MNEQTKQRLLHALLAIAIATVGSAAIAAAIFWGGALVLVILKPRDGQGAWGPLFGSLFALPVSWIAMLIAVYFWLDRRANVVKDKRTQSGK